MFHIKTQQKVLTKISWLAFDCFVLKSITILCLYPYKHKDLSAGTSANVLVVTSNCNMCVSTDICLVVVAWLQHTLHRYQLTLNQLADHLVQSQKRSVLTLRYSSFREYHSLNGFWIDSMSDVFSFFWSLVKNDILMEFTSFQVFCVYVFGMGLPCSWCKGSKSRWVFWQFWILHWMNRFLWIGCTLLVSYTYPLVILR